MLDQTVTNVVGTPNEAVTHYGVMRKRAQPFPSGRDKWETLSYPDDRGVHVKLWPLEELSPEIIRDRWGAGDYMVRWVTLDPSNPVPEHRHVEQGKGVAFALDDAPEPETPAAAPASTMPTDPLLFAMQFAEMQEKKALRMLEAFRSMGGAGGGGHTPAAPSDEVAQMRAELAEMRAEARAAEERRKLEDAHREALAAKDREIERLRREAEDGDRDRGGIALEPGTPLLEQLAPIALNFAAANPEKAATIVAAVGPLVADFLGLKPRPSSPPPAPALAVAPRGPFPAVAPTMRPVMRPVPPGAPAPVVAPAAPPPTSEAWGPIGGGAPSAEPSAAAGE